MGSIDAAPGRDIKSFLRAPFGFDNESCWGFKDSVPMTDRSVEVQGPEWLSRMATVEA